MFSPGIKFKTIILDIMCSLYNEDEDDDDNDALVVVQKSNIRGICINAKCFFLASVCSLYIRYLYCF